MATRQRLWLLIALVICAGSVYIASLRPALASTFSPLVLQSTATSRPLSTPGQSQPDQVDQSSVQEVGSTGVVKLVQDQPLLGLNIDAWLESWLLPGEASARITVLLINMGSAPLVLVKPTLALVGQQTSSIPSLAVVYPASELTLPPQQPVPLVITIDRNMLLPDHYTGNIYYQLQGKNESISIPLDISVRYGPFWPVVVLLLGILLGRLALSMRTPTATKQLHLWPYYLQVKQEIERIPAGQQQEFRQQLSEIYDHIASTDPAQTEDTVRAELRDLESKIQTQLSVANGPTLSGYRLLALVNRPSPTSSPAVLRGLYDLWSWLSRAFASALAFLADHPLPDAALRYWFLRPTLALLLILLLLLIGLQTLYVNSGAIFGSAGLYDYLGLFLWGFSADIAQRSLQNLPQAPSR